MSAVTRVVRVLLGEASGGLTTRSIDEIIRALGIEVDADAVYEAAHRAGLVEEYGGIVGNTAIAGLPVTDRGQLANGEFLSARRPTAERVRVLRRAVICWLYELPEKRARNSAGLLQSPGGWYYGEQFTDEELREAIEFLQAQGMVTGQKAWGGDLLNVRLTAEAQICVEEFDGRFELWRNQVQPGKSIHIGNYNQHGGNAAFGTSGVTNQKSEQVIPDLGLLLSQLAGTLRIALLDQGLRSEDASEIESAVAILDEEANSQTPDQGRVREVLDRLSGKFGVLAMTTAETGATTLVGAAAKTLALYLGWSAA